MASGLWVGIALIIVGIILLAVAAIFAIVRKDMEWWVWGIGILGLLVMFAGIIFLVAGHSSLQGTAL